MARVTGDEVREILDTTLEASELTAFITAASLMVTEVLSDSGYGDELYIEIERWLAAHLVAIRDPRVKSEGFGGANQSFHGASGMGLEHTPYGQQVMVLDYKGYFAAVQNAKRRAELKALA